MKIIHYILILITLGLQKKFMSDYVTTIGDKIYTPKIWSELSNEEREIILIHEGTHIEQFKKEGFKYYLKYLFWPFPCFVAYSRLNYEAEAFAKEIVYSHKKYGTNLFGSYNAKIAKELSGPSYFWTCLNKNKINVVLSENIFKELKK